MPDHLRVLYLHGFASGPHSRKARFFAEKLSAAGVRVEIPTLDEGHFQNLTITGQLQVVDRAVDGDAAILIGSSLGGYLAALYAADHPQISRLLLLAPAFRFHSLWTTRMEAEQLQSWRKNGSLPIFNYAAGREMSIGYQLMEDSMRYQPAPDFSQPALIFHGTQDPYVPVQYSEEFVESHPNAHLIRMNSGHELTDVLDSIWNQSSAFLLGR